MWIINCILILLFFISITWIIGMKISQILVLFRPKAQRIFPMIFIMLVTSVFTIYQDPPPYFNSFYCNLGTKTMAESGDYSCMSPKVIERGDNFALALVEFNKVPGANIWFNA